MTVKDAMIAMRSKQKKEKHKHDFISFSWVVGPSVSMHEKILVFDDTIRFDFAFVINKKYDVNTLTNRRIGTGIYENKKNGKHKC